jgi:hypothetical protein
VRQESRGDQSPNIVNQGGGDINVHYGPAPSAKKMSRPWWQDPAILAALIAAAAAIWAAYIQRQPEPKPQPPPNEIQQSTKGENSPKVVNSGGGTVSVTMQQSDQKPGRAERPAQPGKSTR